MLLTKLFPVLSILYSILDSSTLVAQLLESEENFPFYREPSPFYSQTQFEDYPRGQDWFRVRRQEKKNTYHQKQRLRFENGELNQQETPDFAYSSSVKAPLLSSQNDDPNYEVILPHELAEDENVHDSQSESVRNRRVYTPPAIMRNPVGRPVNGDSGGPCKCDLEYVLKYRGNPKVGSYQIKVYHEETGRFTGNDRGSGWEPPAYPNRNLHNNQRKVYSYPNNSPRQQQQVEYVEVVDDLGDRRDIIHAEHSPKVSVGRKFGVRGGGGLEPIMYKSRNRRAKFSTARQLVKLARNIVASSSRATVSITSSKDSAFEGYPFTQNYRVSDGLPGNSTGIPYLYMTPAVLEAVGYYDDLEILRVSLTMSPHEDDKYECEKADEEDWSCASVTLSGRLVLVISTEELEEAADAVSSRHPKVHLEQEGFFAKIDIKNIVLIENAASDSVHRLQLHDYFHS